MMNLMKTSKTVLLCILFFFKFFQLFNELVMRRK